MGEKELASINQLKLSLSKRVLQKSIVMQACSDMEKSFFKRIQLIKNFTQ